MVSHSLVVGYHGCDLRVARKVISLKDSLHPSQNPWDWLGHGFYFWEDSPARAMRWAEAESTRQDSKIKHPAVLGAVIDLGECLNLADAEALNRMRAAHDAYLQICAENGAQIAQNRGLELRARYLDCAVMEMLHQLHHEEGRPAFDTVRGFFIEGRELYAGAGFRELDHIQICVRSLAQIIGFFWPRQLPEPRIQNHPGRVQIRLRARSAGGYRRPAGRNGERILSGNFMTSLSFFNR